MCFFIKSTQLNVIAAGKVDLKQGFLIQVSSKVGNLRNM